MTDGMKESIKLRANYLNGMAIAVMAVGAFAPMVATVMGFRAFATERGNAIPSSPVEALRLLSQISVYMLPAFSIFWLAMRFSQRLHRQALATVSELDAKPQDPQSSED